MKIAAIRLLCRALIISLAMLSFQAAQAGVITTNQLAPAATAQADRAAVVDLLSRTEVANQLQAMGIDPKAAQDRVAAMTDEEVSSLAGKITALPAGADALGWLLLIAIIGGLVWYFWMR